MLKGEPISSCLGSERHRKGAIKSSFDSGVKKKCKILATASVVCEWPSFLLPAGTVFVLPQCVETKTLIRGFAFGLLGTLMSPLAGAKEAATCRIFTAVNLLDTTEQDLVSQKGYQIVEMPTLTGTDLDSGRKPNLPNFNSTMDSIAIAERSWTQFLSGAPRTFNVITFLENPDPLSQTSVLKNEFKGTLKDIPTCDSTRRFRQSFGQRREARGLFFSEDTKLAWGRTVIALEAERSAQLGHPLSPQPLFEKYQQLLQSISSEIEGNPTVTKSVEAWLPTLNAVRKAWIAQGLGQDCQASGFAISYFTERCGNCVSNVFALLPTLYDLKIPPPEGFQYGVQIYSDHVAPVLFSKTQGVVDLYTLKTYSNLADYHETAIVDFTKYISVALRTMSFVSLVGEAKQLPLTSVGQFLHFPKSNPKGLSRRDFLTEKGEDSALQQFIKFDASRPEIAFQTDQPFALQCFIKNCTPPLAMSSHSMSMELDGEPSSPLETEDPMSYKLTETCPWYEELPRAQEQFGLSFRPNFRKMGFSLSKDLEPVVKVENWELDYNPIACSDEFEEPSVIYKKLRPSSPSRDPELLILVPSEDLAKLTALSDNPSALMRAVPRLARSVPGLDAEEISKLETELLAHAVTNSRVGRELSFPRLRPGDVLRGERGPRPVRSITRGDWSNLLEYRHYDDSLKPFLMIPKSHCRSQVVRNMTESKSAKDICQYASSLNLTSVERAAKDIYPKLIEILSGNALGSLAKLKQNSARFSELLADLNHMESQVFNKTRAHFDVLIGLRRNGVNFKDLMDAAKQFQESSAESPLTLINELNQTDEGQLELYFETMAAISNHLHFLSDQIRFFELAGLNQPAVHFGIASWSEGQFQGSLFQELLLWMLKNNTYRVTSDPSAVTEATPLVAIEALLPEIKAPSLGSIFPNSEELCEQATSALLENSETFFALNCSKDTVQTNQVLDPNQDTRKILLVARSLYPHLLAESSHVLADLESLVLAGYLWAKENRDYIQVVGQRSQTSPSYILLHFASQNSNSLLSPELRWDSSFFEHIASRLGPHRSFRLVLPPSPSQLRPFSDFLSLFDFLKPSSHSRSEDQWAVAEAFQNSVQRLATIPSGVSTSRWYSIAFKSVEKQVLERRFRRDSNSSPLVISGVGASLGSKLGGFVRFGDSPNSGHALLKLESEIMFRALQYIDLLDRDQRGLLRLQFEADSKNPLSEIEIAPGKGYLTLAMLRQIGVRVATKSLTHVESMGPIFYHRLRALPSRDRRQVPPFVAGRSLSAQILGRSGNDQNLELLLYQGFIHPGSRDQVQVYSDNLSELISSFL